MKFKKNKKIVAIIFLAVFFLVLFMGVNGAYATDTEPYKPKAEIPGSEETGMQGYLSGIYNWALGIVGVCALIMVIYGGYQYMVSAGNTEIQKMAKNTINQAIIGLVIALTMFLILNIIDPSITGMSFDIPKIETQPPSGDPH